MDALRLNDVVLRVVAWHNRHPLARRISPDQVHSIGEVVLPFRSRLPWPGQDAPPPAPVEGADRADGADHHDAGQATEASSVGAAAETGDLQHPPPPAWAATPAAALPAAPMALARLGLALRAAWRGLPRPRLRGPRMAPAFSEKFIWPMAPAAVARWAERRAARSAIAPDDWPRRVVATDGLLAHRLEARGLGVALELHLLSAAIGVGDRRIRLLLDARDGIVGPRAYSPARLTGLGSTLASLALAALFGSGALHLPSLDALQSAWPPRHPAAQVATSAAAALPEPAPHGLAAPAHDEPAPHALPSVASAAEKSTPAPEPATTAQAAPATADGHAGDDSPPAHPADTGHADQAPAHASAAAAASAPTPGPAPATAKPPPPAASAAGRLRLALRPQLSQEEREAARESGLRLRGQNATAATGPVYALVTPPTRLRDDSLLLLTRARDLGGRDAALKSAHSDLISARGLWQAALWPFGSRADAERARVALAGKGLKAQVVEF